MKHHREVSGRDLGTLADYGIGNTPLHRAERYCPSGNLYLKLEKLNPNGSIKDRTAFYMIQDLVDCGRLNRHVKLVESSSGNLGLALGFFATRFAIQFVCLIDPSIPSEKVNQLELAGVEVRVVRAGKEGDYRQARIRLAQELDQSQGFIWTNQYDNLANVKAHYESTGPEIWAQTQGCVDYVVCPVGTGGTICGVGRFLKERSPSIRIVAVEPRGSTIFGGIPGPYLSVGTGMVHPSGIIVRYGSIIDQFAQIEDRASLHECMEFCKSEQISVGVSTGSALVVARCLAERHREKTVVALAPDGGENYGVLLQEMTSSR
jgi:cysteine synthase